MSTATFDLALSIPNRIEELERLVKHAKAIENIDEPLYNSVCRALSVLLASHLEGFLKELSRAITLDLNFHLSGFSDMPEPMQRAFCNKIAFYENVPNGEIEKRIQQLISFFGKNPVPIAMDAFTYRENANKNPSSAVIDAAMAELGIPNALFSLNRSHFEVVFDNDERTEYLLRRDLRRFRSYLYHFPFRPLPKQYDFNRSKPPKKSESESLWGSYIQDVLKRRHRVAHGDTLANETTWEELQSDTIKLEVLMHAIMLSAATFLCPPV